MNKILQSDRETIKDILSNTLELANAYFDKQGDPAPNRNRDARSLRRLEGFFRFFYR